MDYLCAKVGNFSFSRFGYCADMQNHTQRRMIAYNTHATIVGVRMIQKVFLTTVYTLVTNVYKIALHAECIRSSENSYILLSEHAVVKNCLQVNCLFNIVQGQNLLCSVLSYACLQYKVLMQKRANLHINIGRGYDEK